MAAGTIPAPITPPTEAWFLLPRWIVGRQGITIEEAGLAGVALLGQDHPDPHQLGLVGQEVDKAGMRDLHELLVVLVTQLDPLLPQRVLADDQRAYPLLHQELD